MTTETVHVGIYDTFADWEIGAATAHINKVDEMQRQSGRYRVVTVGLTLDPIVTMGGMRITPDVTLDQVDPADSAMLILAGSETWESGVLEPFSTKAREFLAADTPVAAICGATGGLAMAGLLDDRDHTSNAVEYLSALGYGGASRYIDTEAVTDRNLITAGATCPFEFAREIFIALDLYAPDKLAAWYQLFDQNDAAAYYALVGE